MGRKVGSVRYFRENGKEVIYPAIKTKKSGIEGKGLFAAAFIPRGTIVWRFGSTDKIYPPSSFKKFTKKKQKFLLRYAYQDNRGNIVLLGDRAKYGNHSCDPNIAGIDWNFDVAIRDINKGEEVTYDYAELMLEGEKMQCKCGARQCRGLIQYAGSSSLSARRLYKKVLKAIPLMGRVKQPLLKNNEFCPCGSGKKWPKCHGFPSWDKIYEGKGPIKRADV